MLKIIRRVLRLSGNLSKRIWGSFICGFLESMFGLLPIAAVFLVLIELQNGQPITGQTWGIVIGLIAGGLILRMIFKYLVYRLQSTAGFEFVARERIALGDRLRNVPMGFFHDTTPYYGVLNDLAMCNPMGIVSPNAFNEDLTTKEELLTQTMGTGPYMYAGDGDGTSYTFVRNPNYWGEQPDVDEFTVKVIADPDAAILALRNGEVDLLAGTSRLSFAGYTELSSADGIGTVLDDSISNSRFIGFNTQEAPFNDAAVRQAVAYAIDKETISDSVFSGLETASEQLLDTSLPYCDVEATTYSYNADKAKELLESAGWVDSDGDGIREKDGAKLSVTLDYITNQGTMDDAALVIAQELGEVGFEVTPRGSDNMTWFTQVSTDFDFSLHTTYGGYYDPFLTMTNMNPEMMSDPILWQVALTMENGTDTIKELDSTADLDRVQEIYNEVLTFTADQAVLVPFTSAHQYAAFNSDKIESFSFGSDQLFIEIANVKAK